MKLSRGAVVGLVLAAVLGVLLWKVAEGHLLGVAPSPLAKLAPAAVRGACLRGLGQNLGGQVEGTNAGTPTWDGARWTWTGAARVDGDPLRFSCALVGGGGAGTRTIIRVLN